MSNFLKFRAVLLLLIIFFANTNISIAATINSKQEKLTLEESQQLREDVQYLLSDKKTIDYEDPRLNKILNKYADKYKLFKVYKDFIEFDKSDKTIEDIKKAKDALSGIYYHHAFCYSDNIIEQFLSLMVMQDNYFDLDEVINKELTGDIRANVIIPLWLVLKYPNILNYCDDRWSLGINASYSVRNLLSFNILDKHITDATGNYLYTYRGSRVNDILSNIYNSKSKVSFAPQLISSTFYDEDRQQYYLSDELYPDLHLWSFEGIWNRLKYKQILKDLDLASDELTIYYQNNYGLAKYAPQAKQVLLGYINNQILGGPMESNPSVEALWYPSFFQYHHTIKKLEYFKDDINLLKNHVKHLTIKKRGFVLFYSVLKNYDINFIRWLIREGADINVIPCGETPLMASVQNKEIMELLLNSGADIHIKNIFGKNVLFYAVQFGNLETVQMLLDNGAESIINNQIYDSDKLEKKMEDLLIFSHCYPTMVNQFTPLIYARRYASQEIIDLLINRGAQNGPADPKKVKEWIAEGPLDL